MKDVCYPYFDPDYENLHERLYGPRVNVDNEACEYCTVVKVDSLEKQGPLLEVLQVFTDMDLLISKSYIFSDAGWFMDVFHVKDKLGNKIRDRRTINYIQQAVYPRGEQRNSDDQMINNYENVKRSEPVPEGTAIEMIGVNRPGLFSEISAVLADEKCNIVEAHAWSHNNCLACVAYVSDQFTASSIDDPHRLATIENHLATVLQPDTIHDNDHCHVKTHFIECDQSMSQTERRLHQLMLASRDFDGWPTEAHPSTRGLFPSMRMQTDEEEKKTMVTIDRCSEKGYLLANIKCSDRPKLMFDTVCTLTDMHYVIFHASITSQDHIACQEYYIRHEDGYIWETDEEREEVSKCLEAAVERRVCEGLRLELSVRTGLLPYVTRTFREYGLTVTRADIAMHREKTSNVFYLQNISGKDLDMESVEMLKRELETLQFLVKTEFRPQRLNSVERVGFSFTNLLRSQFEKFSHSFISP